MKYPRYRVATCSGYLTQRKGNLTDEPGLSATVCDTLYGWAEIKTYRSEDRLVRQGRNVRRGVNGARRDAEDHAAYLNAGYRRALHADVVREGRV